MRSIVLLIAAAISLPCAAAESIGTRPEPVVAIRPSAPLIDERLAVRVSGLPANTKITIAAKTRARDGLVWHSAAEFVSDARGQIDLATKAPVSGSYHGADAMGLFWSMAPEARPKNADHAFFAQDSWKPLETEIQVADKARILATRTIARAYAGSGVRVTRFDGPMHGLLYTPAGSAPHPAVLVIGGSDGSWGRPDVASLLASRGFTTLSLAYFGEAGLPTTLENIPLEYFRRALDWLAKQPSVTPDCIAIYAESRGTEPALWLAASDPRIKAVVARSPSFAFWGGVTAHHWPGAAAWTNDGKPLPYIANRISIGFFMRAAWSKITGTPIRQTELFRKNLADFGNTAAVEIPVEKIRAPVLLLAGKDDQIWPSELMAKRIIARRGPRIGDELLSYDDVGHPIPYTYVPLGGDKGGESFAIGGTLQGEAGAQRNAWPHIVAFLKKAAEHGLAK
jgi:dienelactone hydrolase